MKGIEPHKKIFAEFFLTIFISCMRLINIIQDTSCTIRGDLNARPPDFYSDTLPQLSYSLNRKGIAASIFGSFRRDSDSRLRAYKARTLPTELRKHERNVLETPRKNPYRSLKVGNCEIPKNQCPSPKRLLLLFEQPMSLKLLR